MEELHIGYFPTPIGFFCIECTQHAVVRASFVDNPGEEAFVLRQRATSDLLKQALEQVAQYFEGTRQVFELPLAPQGPPFFSSVWNKLLHIPYGGTTSYGALAAAVGNPKASRAVGSANHNNPIGLIIPCHRVIGANGSLTGYASGLERKRWLLDWEKSHLLLKNASLF